MTNKAAVADQVADDSVEVATFILPFDDAIITGASAQAVVHTADAAADDTVAEAGKVFEAAEAELFAFAEDDDRGTSRVEGFSDGVFATAATLLVFFILLPAPGDDSAGALLTELGKQWPLFIALPLSFFQIGTTWINHHRQFRYICKLDQAVMTWNLLMLLTIVAVPFVTTLFATFIQMPAQARVGGALYGGMWCSGGIFYQMTWLHAVGAGLVDPAMPERARRVVTRRNWLGPIIYGSATVFSLISLPIALFLFLLPIIIFLVPERFFSRRR